MRIRFQQVDAKGKASTIVEEIEDTPHRFNMYQFIDAHPDLEIHFSKLGAWINHTRYGFYYGSNTITQVVERFDIIAYLHWIRGQRLTRAAQSITAVDGSNE